MVRQRVPMCTHLQPPLAPRKRPASCACTSAPTSEICGCVLGMPILHSTIRVGVGACMRVPFAILAATWQC